MEQAGGGEEDLAGRLAEDVDSSFERLVLTYQDRLYRFALRLSGSPQDAEEIAQDSFVRAYHALARYGPDRIRTMTLRPWLYQICLNVFRNRIRRRTLEVVTLDGGGPEGGQERPEQMAEAAERARELSDLLGTLPERYRTTVILRHIEGLSIAEIAAIVGQPEGTVKSNIHRGLASLREVARMEREEIMR